MLIWIIDEEWKDYDLEKEILAKEFPNLEIRISSYDYEKDLKEFGYKADGILAQVYANIPGEVIEKLEKCKGIAVYGGGYDRIDITAAKEKGIHVTNIQGYCAEDLADYVIASMFMVNKKIMQYSSKIKEDVKNNRWGAMAVDENVHRLSEETLFIVGFGMIGRTLAKKAKLFGMQILAYDEFLSQEEIEKEGVKKVSWEDGFKMADYISINLKGVDENKDKITYKEFTIMKNSATLINTARGKIVNEEDLIRAIKEKQIKCAILDVIKNEPPVENDPILNCENVFVTPHISYISVESFRALKEFAIGNLIAMLRSEKPRDFVC